MISVLDVGSCFNPLPEVDEKLELEVTAIDIAPASNVSRTYC